MGMQFLIFFFFDWIGLSKMFGGTSPSDQYGIIETIFTLWSEKKTHKYTEYMK